MKKVRVAGERGVEDKGWIQSYFTFSFQNYLDPLYAGFRTLRALNEVTLKGGKNLGMHPHKEIEILTYVIEGALEVRDVVGNSAVVSEGSLHRLNAGTGTSQARYNLSHELPVRFIEMWVDPAEHNLTPSALVRPFSSASKWGQWCLLASRTGRGGSIPIHQDMDLYTTLLDQGDGILFEALLDRYYWIHVISGSFLIQDATLNGGDGVEILEESPLNIRCLQGGALLLMDLA